MQVRQVNVTHVHTWTTDHQYKEIMLVYAQACTSFEYTHNIPPEMVEEGWVSLFTGAQTLGKLCVLWLSKSGCWSTGNLSGRAPGRCWFG